MTLYAEVPAARARQVALDVAVLAWTAVWVRVGLRIDELVTRLGTPGRDLESAGAAVARFRVPALRTSLGPITDGGQALARAGVAQQHAVHTLALWLGVLVAALPIAWALARYVPGRVAWVREASAARRLRDEAVDGRLFALRALATQPLVALRRAAPDPMAAYDAGDVDGLAALELARLGLRPH